MPLLCLVTKVYPVYSIYSSAVIVSVRCPCQTPPSFNAMDAAFPLINQCKFIKASLVGYPSILGSMGIGKSARTFLTLIVAPTIFSCTLGGIGDGFIMWD